MPLVLSDRQPRLQERMDDPSCDRRILFNTYRNFSTVNGLISRWQSVYRKHIRPQLDAMRTTSLLDIGSGGGDIPRRLKRWAEADGLKLHVTATDPDPRALEYIRQNYDASSDIEYLQEPAETLLEEGRLFDLVISNHLAHHLDDKALLEMAELARRLSTDFVLFNDIERGDLGYAMFNLLTLPLFRDSFIREDGLISIRRSFTRSELRQLLPEGWEVHSLFPYRILMIYRHDHA